MNASGPNDSAAHREREQSPRGDPPTPTSRRSGRAIVCRVARVPNVARLLESDHLRPQATRPQVGLGTASRPRTRRSVRAAQVRQPAVHQHPSPVPRRSRREHAGHGQEGPLPALRVAQDPLSARPSVFAREHVREPIRLAHLSYVQAAFPNHAPTVALIAPESTYARTPVPLLDAPIYWSSVTSRAGTRRHETDRSSASTGRGSGDGVALGVRVFNTICAGAPKTCLRARQSLEYPTGRPGPRPASPTPTETNALGSGARRSPNSAARARQRAAPTSNAASCGVRSVARTWAANALGKRPVSCKATVPVVPVPEYWPIRPTNQLTCQMPQVRCPYARGSHRSPYPLVGSHAPLLFMP